MKRLGCWSNTLVLVGSLAALLSLRGETWAGRGLQVPDEVLPSGIRAEMGLSVLSGGLGSDLVEVDSRRNQALEAPRVAFNSRDRLFLAVWEDHYGNGDWDIDGRVLDPAGRLVGEPFGIAWKGSVVQEQADVAYNAFTNQLLVVYALSPNNGNVSSTLVAGDGTPSGVFVHIADTAAKELRPAVACDPTTAEYLVVYEREQNQGGTIWHEVWAQPVKRDGTLTGSPTMLNMPKANGINSAIASAGGQYLAAWQEPSGAKSYLCGRFIRGGTPSLLYVFNPYQDEFQSCPQIAYNPARAEYLIVYQAKPSTGTYNLIKAIRVSAVGGVSPAVTVATAAREHCTVPDVAHDPADDRYVVVWAQGPAASAPESLPAQQIMAVRVDGDGHPVGDPVPVSGPGLDQPLSSGIPAPAVAAGTGKRSLVVWEELTVVQYGKAPTLSLSRILGATGAWGAMRGDLDGDNDVDLIDLAILAEDWCGER